MKPLDATHERNDMGTTWYYKKSDSGSWYFNIGDGWVVSSMLEKDLLPKLVNIPILTTGTYLVRRKNSSNFRVGWNPCKVIHVHEGKVWLNLLSSTPPYDYIYTLDAYEFKEASL